MRATEVSPGRIDIFRAGIFHTPRNPFESGSELVSPDDGALAVQAGRIAGCGDYIEIRAQFPDAVVHDWRDGFLLPGLIDLHVHFPQTRALGGLGYSLPEWLGNVALPEEARMADKTTARIAAHEFLHGLVSHGTTTALVFGSHFADAQMELFIASEQRGLRIVSGMVVSDRNLIPALHRGPEDAGRESKNLIDRFHRRGRLRYAVTPRFAVSASDAMLSVCRDLLSSDESLAFTTHINENTGEVSEAVKLFPGCEDYLSIYEKFGLVGRRAVLAHNVHATAGELSRIRARGASVAHCPCSNMALGSGIFPMRRHLDAGVRFGLGTDVGAGTGFGILKEAVQAHLLQRVAPEPVSLSPAQMLWLSTGAGAEALGMEREIGDFTTGKAADFVFIRPAAGSTLSVGAAQIEDPSRRLAAVMMMAGRESIAEVRVEGDVVYSAKA